MKQISLFSYLLFFPFVIIIFYYAYAYAIRTVLVVYIICLRIEEGHLVHNIPAAGALSREHSS